MLKSTRGFLPALAIGFVIVSRAVNAQDTLTLGAGSAASGATAQVPVYARDASGTPAGLDAGAGNRIQGLALKVTYAPASAVAGIGFVRAGVLEGLTARFETFLVSTGALAYVGSFAESGNSLPFTLNAPAPGDRIGTLQVTFAAQAPAGTVVTLTIESTTAMLANQAGTIGETVASTGLALTAGTATVGGFSPPGGFVATATSASAVGLSWGAVAGADHYEVFRTPNIAQAFTLLDTAPAAAYSDTNVAGGTTYLYKVRAVDGVGTPSAFSAIDAATTVVFTDDPLNAGLAVKGIHLSELRTAVNALRAAANLAPFTFADPDLTGVPIRAQHISQLRQAMNAARSVLFGAGVAFADPTLTSGSTIVKAVHILDIRSGVK
jgi:hypothetical protein